jgi:Protein of unknown function (DUF3618)
VAQTADELEANIAVTREDMSATLNVIGDQVSPEHVVTVGKQRFRQWMQSARDGIMGSVPDEEGQASEDPQGLGSGVGVSGVGVSGQAPGNDHGPAAGVGSQGNPIAAGLIAFGVGLLAGSVLRATKAEQKGLAVIADKTEPAIDAAMQAASELSHGLTTSTEQIANKVGGAITEVGQEIVDQTQAATSQPEGAVKPSD